MTAPHEFWLFIILACFAVVGALCILAAISDVLVRLLCRLDSRKPVEWDDASLDRLLAAMRQQQADDEWADLCLAVPDLDAEYAAEVIELRIDLARFEKGEVL